MKKITFLLCLLMGIFSQAQAQKAYYFHLKGGDIQVFYTDLVDSMTVAPVENPKAVEDYYQQVWTADTVFQYKMSEIDSISYVTPPTQYKPGVIKMEDGLLDYVIGCDSLTLHLKADTPKRKLPRVGDKLVCLEMTKILPNGFAGEVTRVTPKSDNIEVECTLVSLTEIFDQYYSVNHSEVPVSPKARRTKDTRSISSFGHYEWNPNPINLNLTAFVNANIRQSEFGTIEFESRADLTYRPSINIRSALIVSKETGTYVNFSCIGNHSVLYYLAMTGSINAEYKADLLSFEAPLGQPLVRAYIQIGPFLRASTKVSARQVSELDYRTAICWNWSSRGDAPLKNTLSPLFLNSKRIIASEGSIQGTLATGFYFETGLLIADKDIAKAYINTEAGAEISGNGVIVRNDVEYAEDNTQVYDILRNTGVKGHFYGGVGLGAEAGVPGIIHTGWNVELLSVTFGKPFLDYRMAPEFTDLKAAYSKEELSHLDVSAIVTGRSRPVDVGFVIRDENKEKIEKLYVLKNYTGKEKQNVPYRHTFLNVPTDQKLTVSPMITYGNIDVTARPSVEVNAQPYVVTGGALNVQEKSADIKITFYNVNDEVTDGGVLYAGENGLQSASLPAVTNGDRLVKLSGLKENTTYSYKAYIKWNGQYKYGEIQQFTTKKKVDEGPTPGLWIDLGLPSGVKWASHNVGASSPEGYGAYFAWGETSPKSSYTLENYKFSIWETDENGNCYFVDFRRLPDFSGNLQHDAAAANWGGGARMPTDAEFKELVTHCTFVWTTINGVNGRLVTGPNGNSIFLPAAGERDGTSLILPGEIGNYLSSTPYEDYGHNVACYLYFDSGGFGWGITCRSNGLSVRPVRN